MSSRIRLVLLSSLMLFVELALIRWMGSNIVYLSYFSNFVLLGSFLGIGAGFLRGSRSPTWFAWAPVALLALVVAVLFFPVEIDRTSEELIFFGSEPSGPPIWLVLPLVFVAVAGVLMLIASGVARVFETFEPLEAYRLDIAGSISGIAMFTLLSYLHAPPVAWGVVAAVLFLLTLDLKDPSLRRSLGVVALVGIVVLLGIETVKPGTSWSPYYKIQTFTPPNDPEAVAINVNGVPHQTASDIAKRDAVFPLYQNAYKVANPHPEDVLVIGAGSGNDVAEALSQGVKHVDAVEIDPRINQIGRERHPNRPYDDPRVEIHLDDGRAFIERTEKKYDLIVLALPDSITLVAGQSSLRLESYLFTKDAFESYRDHLKPDGVFTMYNVYREDWLRDRYAGTVQEVFGTTPCLLTISGEGTVAAMTVGMRPELTTCDSRWSAAGAVPVPATDDLPFPYLREPGIPSFYLLTMALILVASVALVVLVTGREGAKSMVRFTDLFFMGVAFLLLETKSVVQFALLFGTTWLVNALVFMGVLVSVYLAVEMSKRIRRMPSPVVLYSGLLVSVAIAWLVPLASLLQLAFWPRFVVAVALAFAPVFFANLIFAQRFRDESSSTSAFGANLLGAMVGGLLEYSALVLGYRNLLVLVAVLYGAAFVAGRRALRSGGAGAPAAAGGPAG